MNLGQITVFVCASMICNLALAIEVHSDRLNTPFKAVVMGHSFVAPIANDFGGLVENNADFSNYDQSVFYCGGKGGDPFSLWNSPCTQEGPDNPMNLNEKQRIQNALDEGDVDLLVMTYHPEVNSLAGHRLWIDYAKSQNPNTVYAIVLPWATEPCTWNAQTGDDYIAFDDMIVQPSIDLIAQQKEVTIFFIPHGYGPMQLAQIYTNPNQAQHYLLRSDIQAFSLHTDAQSPNCQRVSGPGDQAIFRDELGHVMPLAKRTAALIFGASIFDLTFDSYQDSYATDLSAIAEDVVRFTDSRHPAHKSLWRD